MPLNDDDIREILRLIDESDVGELHIETAELSLHVVRGGVAAEPETEEPVETEAQSAPAAGDDLVPVASPMLGTFYRASAPGGTPFVEVGGRVDADTVVCLIEVMKMMNPIPAGVAGTVVDVCVDNAELVEPGAVLFRVRADS